METLIISEDAEIHKVRYKCNTCGQEAERVVQGDVVEERHSCGGYLQIVSDVDVVEEVVEIAERSGVAIQFISADSEYGKELLLGFGGIAALLKYK